MWDYILIIPVCYCHECNVLENRDLDLCSSILAPPTCYPWQPCEMPCSNRVGLLLVIRWVELFQESRQLSALRDKVGEIFCSAVIENPCVIIFFVPLCNMFSRYLVLPIIIEQHRKYWTPDFLWLPNREVNQLIVQWVQNWVSVCLYICPYIVIYYPWSVIQIELQYVCSSKLLQAGGHTHSHSTRPTYRYMNCFL